LKTALKELSRPRAVFAGLTLLALWFVLCRQLSGEWSINEQYSYGWFVPFFAAFLFWLRWEDRPPAFAKATTRSGVDGLPSRSLGEGWKAEGGMEPAGAERHGPGPKGERAGGSESRRERNRLMAIAIVALLALFPLRLFEVANPDWRPVDWIHAAVVIGLTLLMIWAAGGKPWLRHFAFPVCFFFVAVPWITPIEEPIVQGLMRTVAAVATETITLFGVPAQLEGNLIRVSTGLVGVNEACSGVRSLQTSLMIGLLFGELKRLSVGKRLALVVGALAIAVVANFGRAFFLVWVAGTQSVSAVDRWHDAAGYTIVGVVFLGSLGLAALLGRPRRQVGRRKEEGGNEDHRPPPSPFLLPPSYFLLCLSFLLAVEAGVESWYRVHERGLIARERWSARWPETAKDFRDIHIDETTRRILRFDEGRGAMWKIQKSEDGSRRTEDGTKENVQHPTSNAQLRTSDQKTEEAALLYFFRWRAGSNSALLANLHRPDVCLPASGWIQAGDYGIRSYPVSPKFSLPFRHFLFSQGSPGPGNGGRQRFADAFYCLREDRVLTESDASLAREEFAQEPTDWSRRERLSLVLQGRRHLGQQVMEFVLLTPREVAPAEAEARFAQELPELIQVESRK
jgi:exosortase